MLQQVLFGFCFHGETLEIDRKQNNIASCSVLHGM